MKSMFIAAALGFALTFSVTTQAAENAAMPVFFQAVKNGPTYQVLAQKDGAYFPVFTYTDGKPFFTDSNNEWHFVNSDNEKDNYAVFYVSGQTTAPVALPQGKSEDQVKDILTSGNDKTKDSLVHWGNRGYYGYEYYNYNNYCYSPTYYYGGYYGNSYYGGGYYSGSYYNNGYYGYGYNTSYYTSGYYGYRSYGYTNYYSGRGCVLNNWYW